MGAVVQPLAELVAWLIYASAAVCAATVAVWLGGRRGAMGQASVAIIGALLLTAAWCIALATSADGGLTVELTRAARNLSWIFVVYRLFAMDGRHESVKPIRPVLLALIAVEALDLGTGLFAANRAGEIADLQLAPLLRLLFAVGGLVLVHNLFVGASRETQAGLRWIAGGLALSWAVDLNLYTIAWLSGEWPPELAATRGLGTILLAAFVAIGAAQAGSPLRFRPSRAVTFQTFSLLVIGVYLIGMVAIAQWLSLAGSDFARLMELTFLTLATALAIVLLPSQRMRSWLKVTLAKHFFQHRYDYREEWLRFTRTIGAQGDGALPLGERVVQAVADIAESRAGLLLAGSENGDLTLAARWQWPSADVPAVAMMQDNVAFFEKDGFIVDLDDVRAGREDRGEAVHIPEWLLDDPRAWALVPLIHYDRLVGMVVLARPSLPRRFDWEDYDLLRIVGQQLASYLAENAMQDALAEASRFDDFHRRIAFVMHDIKNLASQLSLLARNAELHADKPAFRDDMLLTLRNSADKLNALLARLSRYGGGAVDQLTTVPAGEVARAAVARFRAVHPVILTECQPCDVAAHAESLEQVLVHLIQNAVDASAPDSPVFLALTLDGLMARYEVVDSGCGMSPDFIRNRLFKPFVSSKPGGFGIGAFEARELVRAMRGRLDVESREGLGSRFTVRLPLAVTAGLADTLSFQHQRLAS
ncbi:MAG: PEP-CTERM system histidine kinase PrsK [Novosphingobium sp.]|nr:PEP-CTERM system histidine kinase PrsK [Novosphingobium sp.]